MAKWKMGEYKEDVTRGGRHTVLNPRTYKGDSLVSVWLDRRKLAGICEYMVTHGSESEKPRFMSDILRFVIDRAYEQLLGAGLCNQWEVMKAGEYLESRFNIELNPDGRGKKNLQHNLILESRNKEAELNYRTPAIAEIDKVERVNVRPEDIEAARRSMRVINSENNKIDYSKIDDTPIVNPVKVNKNLPWIKEDGSVDYEIYTEYVKRKRAEHTEGLRIQKEKDKFEEKERKRKLKQEMKDRDEADKLMTRLEAIRERNNKCVNNSDQPRPKTNEELDADDERRKIKEKELMDALNCPAPAGIDG